MATRWGIRWIGIYTQILLVVHVEQHVFGWFLGGRIHLEQQPQSRRDALLQTMLLKQLPALVSSCGVTLSTMIREPQPAMATTVIPSGIDVGESIRRAASSTIPGLGPPDVYYPIGWRGIWNVRREMNDPSTIGIDPSKDSIVMVVEYKVRFVTSSIPTPPNGNAYQPESVAVADRGFNTVNLENALSRQRAGEMTAAATTVVVPLVQSYEWKETNPNDLRIVMTDGSRKDIKVTKRATERTEVGTVFSSEFYRLTYDTPSPGGGWVPTIQAHRVLTKWKEIDANNLEAIEIVYDMGLGIDPLGSGSTTIGKPKLISKSRLFLRRAS